MPTFSLAGQLRIQPTWTDTMSTTDVVDSVEVIRPLTLANGTGPAQANAYWRDVRTVTGPSTDSINIGSLPVSVFGGSGNVSLSSVKLIYVRNTSSFQPLFYALPSGGSGELPPGGMFLWSSPTAGPTGPWMAGPTGIAVQNQGATGGQYEIVVAGVKTP